MTKKNSPSLGVFRSPSFPDEGEPAVRFQRYKRFAIPPSSGNEGEREAQRIFHRICRINRIVNHAQISRRDAACHVSTKSWRRMSRQGGEPQLSIVNY
jgi:hypothetical protein